MLKLANVTKKYITGNGEITANNNVTYEFPQKGFVFILGKSGCGKTTLLNLIAGFIGSDSGDILMNEKNISQYQNEDLDKYHNLNIGVIFQQYNLIEDINVYDNLKIVLDIQKKISDNDEINCDKKICDILEMVDLAGYEKRRISELSGGEKQRIAIARALLKETDIILADEPTGNLDYVTGEKVLGILSEIAKNKLVVMVSHDVSAARKYADVIINMKDGEITSVDNTNTRCEFSFQIEENGVIKKYSSVSKFEMISIIEDSVNSQCGNINIMDIRCSDNIKKDESDNNVEEKKTETKTLDKKYTIGFASKFLAKKKTRMLFTALIFSLSFVLIYFAIYISFYNKNKLVTRYMDKYNPPILETYISCEYINSLGEKRSSHIDRGKYFYDFLNDKLDKSAKLMRIGVDEALFPTDEDDEMEHLSRNTSIVYIDADMCPVTTNGRKLTSTDEIIITDYLAELLNVDTGDMICDLYNNYTVVGIIDTDYEDYKLVEKIENDYGGEFFNYKCKYQYIIAYTLSGQIEERINNCKYLSVPGGNMFVKKINAYSDCELVYSSINSISEEGLICGRMPERDNEVVISESLADCYGITPDLIGQKVNYKDLYNEKYNDVYSYCINMFSYFPDGIIISGIVSSSETANGEVYISDKIWNELKYDYYQYYNYKYVIAPESYQYSELVENADKNGIYLSEPGINRIYDFNSMIIKIKPVLYLILCIIAGINFFTIAVFLGFSIYENGKNIGILRSIGIPMAKCSEIFNYEMVLLYIISVFAGSVGIGIIINRINAFYMKSLTENKFNIIIFSALIFFVTTVLELVVSVISAGIPIKELKKKNIIELMQ